MATSVVAVGLALPVTAQSDDDSETLTVTFFGCGNVEIIGSDDEFPLDMTLLIYNPGQESVREVSGSLSEGERPGSPGGQLIGVETSLDDYVNPNFDFDARNCGDAGGGPAAGEQGDPRDRLRSEGD